MSRNRLEPTLTSVALRFSVDLAVFGVVVAVYTVDFLRLNLAPYNETIRVAGITASPAPALGINADVLGEHAGSGVRHHPVG